MYTKTRNTQFHDVYRVFETDVHIYIHVCMFCNAHCIDITMKYIVTHVQHIQIHVYTKSKLHAVCKTVQFAAAVVTCDLLGRRKDPPICTK